MRQKSRDQPADDFGGVVDHRNDAGIIEPGGADDAQDADDLLLAIAVGSDDERGAGQREELILRADEDAHPLSSLGKAQELDQLLLVFDVVEKLADALEIIESGHVLDE